MAKKLTTTMQEAYDYAKEHGGELLRYPGGFWAPAGWGGPREKHFGTTTVYGLVSRGAAEYTEYRTNSAWPSTGSFPIRMQIKEGGIERG